MYENKSETAIDNNQSENSTIPYLNNIDNKEGIYKKRERIQNNVKNKMKRIQQKEKDIEEKRIK